MTSPQERAGDTLPPVSPASAPAHTQAPKGDGAGDGQAAPPTASRTAPAVRVSPERGGRGTPSSQAPAAVPGAGEGMRVEVPGMLRPAGTSPAQAPPGGTRPLAVPPGGSKRTIHPIAAAMSEDDLEEKIRDACKKLGILRFHVHISRGTTAGLPDDILIGPCGILWRENKRQGGRPTPAQVKTGEALTAIGQDYALWRPEDWLSGRITRELLAISGMGRTPPRDAA